MFFSEWARLSSEGLFSFAARFYSFISIPLLLTPFLEDAPQLLRLFPEAEVVVNVSCIAATLIAALLLAALGTVLCSSQLHS